MYLMSILKHGRRLGEEPICIGPFWNSKVIYVELRSGERARIKEW
jgi:hypothetical protein